MVCCSVYYYTVDETINAAADDDAEKENTQIKQADAGESLEATPSEQPRPKTPSPAKHMLSIVAEAGGSARHLLANIRSRRKRGKTSFR